MKVCFETFGCRLNRAEALEQEAEFLARGWTTTESHADADLVVVRGCSVTRRAQRDSEKLIEHIRAKYPVKRVVVTGCLPSADKSFFMHIGRIGRASVHGPAAPSVPTRTARAYLKVQDGCSGRCAFCIVPKFRGKATSVDFDAVLDKARRFIDAGYHEIVVTGCNLSLYASQGRRLPELLAALADLACRIRLGSLEPSHVARDVVRVAAERANVCRFLHIPVQSGSNRMLVAMRRPYFAREVDDLVREAVRTIPDVALGCDLMTGFPDELDLDHLSTKTFLSRHPFSRVHVFPYSERPGTSAAELPGVVPKELRRARAAELTQLADSKRSAFAKRFVGKTVEIVVEDEKTCTGWTSEYLWCTCPHAHAPRKSLLSVRVKSAQGHVLVGEAV